MSLMRREKYVIVIALACIGLLIAFLAVMRPALNRTTTLKRVVQDKQKVLSQLKSKSNEYNTLKKNLEQIRSKIENQQKDKRILSSIEQIQKDCGLTQNVVNITPTIIPISDEYEKTTVDIKYNSITLSKIIQFLLKVDSSDLLIGIKSIEINKSLQNPDLLDITIQLVSVTHID